MGNCNCTRTWAWERAAEKATTPQEGLNILNRRREALMESLSEESDSESVSEWLRLTEHRDAALRRSFAAERRRAQLLCLLGTEAECELRLAEAGALRLPPALLASIAQSRRLAQAALAEMEPTPEELIALKSPSPYKPAKTAVATELTNRGAGDGKESASAVRREDSPPLRADSPAAYTASSLESFATPRSSILSGRARLGARANLVLGGLKASALPQIQDGETTTVPPPPYVDEDVSSDASVD